MGGRAQVAGAPSATGNRTYTVDRHERPSVVPVTDDVRVTVAYIRLDPRLSGGRERQTPVGQRQQGEVIGPPGSGIQIPNARDELRRTVARPIFQL